MKIECTCFVCSAKFFERSDRIPKGRGKYCSHACRDEARRTYGYVAPRACEFCGKAFLPNERRSRFCSRACINQDRLSDPIERFWKQVDKSENEKGCWIWKGFIEDKGYGRFSIFIENKWETVGSHRYAWELECGPIPKGIFVLHACDNPPCVRVHPDHLFLGTQNDNTQDMVHKNRQAKGERVGTSKLTEEIVRTIRDRFANGESSYAIAKTLPISETNIRDIVQRKSWKHVI